MSGAALGEAPAALSAPVERQVLARGAHGGAHQHHPAAVVHAHTLRLSGGVKNPSAEALGAENLNLKRAALIQIAQQRPLRLPRQLLGHDDELRPRVRAPQQFGQRGLHQSPAPGVHAKHRARLLW